MRNRNNEKGLTLIVGTLSMLLIVPMIGLSIDVGFLYAVKSKMQAAVDGSALAAARGLSDGSTLSAQESAAENNAVAWFNANFPSNYFGTYNINMTTSNVIITQSSTNVRNVAVSATASVDTFFMKWLGFGATTVGANGTASRRDVVIMLVLDRSFSIQLASACTTMKAAAKAFTGQFAEGRDMIGLVSFADDVLVQSAPTTSFQSTLGYTQGSNSGTGLIDNINCQGNTGTAQALSVAYNELWKINLPGALNAILLETDGLPNTMTLNFWDSTNVVSGVSSSSACVDLNSKTESGGGFKTLTTIVNGASVRQWTPKVPLGTSSYLPSSLTYTTGGTVYTPQGIVGAVGSCDPGDATGGCAYMFTMQEPYTGVMPPAASCNTTSCFESAWASNASTGAYKCGFGEASAGEADLAANNYTTPPTDFAWFPATDVYGNYLNPSGSEGSAYQSVTMTGSHVANSGYTNFHNASENTADNAAYRIRNGFAFPSPNASENLQATIYVVGLGGTVGSPPDPILMQRIANDPNGDQLNSPAKYAACSTESNCVTYSSQPQGVFIYSASPSVWGQAFVQIASQILRLSH